MAATILTSGGFSPFPTYRKYRRRLRTAAKLLSLEERVKLRVCINRSCSWLGSWEMLKVLLGLAPPSITVASCQCLNHCGASPNLIVLQPSEAPTAVSHVGTTTKVAQLLAGICGSGFDPEGNLEAVKMREGKDQVEKGNASEAESLLSRLII